MGHKKADIIDLLPDDVTELLSELAFNDAMEVEEQPEPEPEPEPEAVVVAQTPNRVVSLGRVNPDDPAELGYPPTLPIEVALQTAPMDDIRVAYGFSVIQWDALRELPQFKSDLEAARKMLTEEGMSFKAKARLQSEELLKTSWQMIHDTTGDVPPNVKADLLKFTVRAAGLEASAKDQPASFTPLQININI
jgi:hypothetical protein